MRKRSLPEINASTMADISFLLLVFFLVATTFLKDKGVPATLPPYYEGPPGPMSDHYVLDIKVNKYDQLLIEGEEMDITNLNNYIKIFIQDPSKSSNFATKAIISLQNDVETSYNIYLQVYSIIRKAYKEMRTDLAKHRFDTPYEDLTTPERNEIIASLPIKISEADPYQK